MKFKHLATIDLVNEERSTVYDKKEILCENLIKTKRAVTAWNKLITLLQKHFNSNTLKAKRSTVTTNILYTM